MSSGNIAVVIAPQPQRRRCARCLTVTSQIGGRSKACRTTWPITGASASPAPQPPAYLGDVGDDLVWGGGLREVAAFGARLLARLVSAALAGLGMLYESSDNGGPKSLTSPGPAVPSAPASTARRPTPWPPACMSRVTSRVSGQRRLLTLESGDPAGRNGGNCRNGHRPKTVLTEIEPIEVDVPRDRQSTFEPKIVSQTPAAAGRG
jgi:hypothetical protein